MSLKHILNAVVRATGADTGCFHRLDTARTPTQRLRAVAVKEAHLHIRPLDVV
jgi:hypothetical protein